MSAVLTGLLIGLGMVAGVLLGIHAAARVYGAKQNQRNEEVAAHNKRVEDRLALYTENSGRIATALEAIVANKEGKS